jgi:hypothetical protein
MGLKLIVLSSDPSELFHPEDISEGPDDGTDIETRAATIIFETIIFI